MKHEHEPHSGQGPHDPQSGGEEHLRALLRAADPAARLADVDPAWVTWKVRQTMDDTGRPAAALRPARARRRTGLFAGVGLGTAVAGVVATVTIATSGAAVTALTLPAATSGGPAAACAPVTTEALAQREAAFEGRVSAIQDGQVTLEVTHRYKGDVEDEVSVPQPGADLGAEFSPGQFSTGADYLISTFEGGQVAVCGQSGPASPELRSLYRLAYGG